LLHFQDFFLPLGTKIRAAEFTSQLMLFEAVSGGKLSFHLIYKVCKKSGDNILEEIL